MLQLPFTIVQLSTVVPPTVISVTVDPGEFGLVTVPGPLLINQLPVPGEAAFAARVNVVPFVHKY